MDYLAMLDRMKWSPANLENDIRMADRILTSLRTAMQKDIQQERIREEYRTYWEAVADRNLYVAALLLKRMEKLYGSGDVCAKCGMDVIFEEILDFQPGNEEEMTWKVLAEVEMRVRWNGVDYLRRIVSNGRHHFKQYVAFLRHSNCVAGSILFFCHAFLIQNLAFRRKVVKALMLSGLVSLISEADNGSLAVDIVDRCIQWGDIPVLNNLLALFEDMRMTDYCDKTMEEWKAFLLTQFQPVSMSLYYNMLKREGYSAEERLKELYDFTMWVSGRESDRINDYLYFAYSVTDFPEKYDTYAALFEQQENRIADREAVEGPETAVSERAERREEATTRWHNYLLVELPFITLIRKNPEKVPDFLERMGPVSRFHRTWALKYRKTITWNNNSGFLPDYKRYITEYALKHSPAETLDVYLSSPLKAVIDFSYVLRRLYQPQEGFVDLREELDGITLRGVLMEKMTEQRDTSYRVWVSSVHSTYRFPVHHSWIREHMEEMEEKFSEGAPVFFKIMSINSRGMIFVYDLIPKFEKNGGINAGKDAVTGAEDEGNGGESMGQDAEGS